MSCSECNEVKIRCLKRENIAAATLEVQCILLDLANKHIKSLDRTMIMIFTIQMILGLTIIFTL